MAELWAHQQNCWLSGTRQVKQVHVSIEDDGKLFREQLVEADTIMNVQPAFTCPVIALRSTVKSKEIRLTEKLSFQISKGKKGILIFF